MSAPSLHRSPLRSFPSEPFAFWHLALLLLFSAWALGGNAGWSQQALCFAGSAGFILTLVEAFRRFREGGEALRPFWILTPWFAFNVLIAASTLHPNLRLISIENADAYIPLSVSSAWPSSARPELTWHALWLSDALFIPAFNLLLAIRSRSLLRYLLLLFSANAVVLAIFGSFQKLSHASGLFFGQVASPNVTFFATFIYDNHWGAFVILALATALGLFFRRADFATARAFFNSPAFGGALLLIILAASVPLSSSRSCTALVLVLLAVALMDLLRRIARAQRTRVDGSRKPLFLVVIASGLALVAIYALARPVIAQRVAQTRSQIENFHQTHSIGARAELYGDTWKMAKDRPWFGWGLGSYGTVFARYNTQEAVDRLPQYYEDAHSDWLQAAAETGLIGCLLRGLLVILPLATLARSLPWRSLTTYSLLGCGLIFAYAALEFPFGNVAVTLAWWTCFFASVRLAQLDARGAAS